jgi:hypothetical protein
LRHIVSFSGGLGSWMAAMRVRELHGVEPLTLLFTDTLIEDSDTYRFLIEGAAVVFGIPIEQVSGLAGVCNRLPLPRGPLLPARKALLAHLRDLTQKAIPGLVWVADGRTPFEVFADNRFLGNTRVDLCSRVLKREQADTWLAQNCDPADTVVHVGIDWTEEHRFIGTGTKAGLRARKAAQGWTYAAPLCEAPFVTKAHGQVMLAQYGIKNQRLYTAGMAHANCGGGCVKQGQGGFALLLDKMPEHYDWWEEEEENLRAIIGKDVAILRDRTGGTTKPMTLREFRARRACNSYDKDEFGGCGCFIDE